MYIHTYTNIYIYLYIYIYIHIYIYKYIYIYMYICRCKMSASICCCRLFDKYVQYICIYTYKYVWMYIYVVAEWAHQDAATRYLIHMYNAYVFMYCIHICINVYIYCCRMSASRCCHKVLDKYTQYIPLYVNVNIYTVAQWAREYTQLQGTWFICIIYICNIYVYILHIYIIHKYQVHIYMCIRVYFIYITYIYYTYVSSTHIYVYTCVFLCINRYVVAQWAHLYSAWRCLMYIYSAQTQSMFTLYGHR